MSKTYKIGKCPRCKCEDSKIIASGLPMIICQKCRNWSLLDDADDNWVKVEGKDENEKEILK